MVRSVFLVALMGLVACGGELGGPVAEPDYGRLVQGGTETGNPGLRHIAFSSSSTVLLGGWTSGKTYVDELWISDKNFNFVDGTGCPVLGSVDLAGPIVAETTSVGSVLSGTAVSGTQCAFVMQMNTVAGSHPSGLGGGSIEVTGQRSDGTSFLIRSSLTSTIVFSGTWSMGSADKYLIGIDVATLLTGIGLESASTQGGTVTIDATHNTGVLSAFEANLSDSLGLYLDSNNDGVIGTGEGVPVAAP